MTRNVRVSTVTTPSASLEAAQWYVRQPPPFETTLPTPVFFRTEHMPARGSYPQLCHAWGEFVYSYVGVTEVIWAGGHCLTPPLHGLWIPAGVGHTGLNQDESVHCSVYIDARLCATFPTSVCAVVISPLIRATLEHLRAHPPGESPAPRERRLLRVLVDLLRDAPTVGSYLPSTEDPKLAALLHALQRNPADARSLGELADAFHFSERTLMRHAQETLGMSLTEWRQRLKVVTALPMLQAGRSVEAVAFDLGYATSSAFISMFRRLTGATPKQGERR